MKYIFTVHDRMFGGFPAKNTVYTPYIYGSGQPYTSSLVGRHVPAIIFVLLNQYRLLC